MGSKLHWYRIRLLLMGADRGHCEEAVEDMREELLNRPYLTNPGVDWESDTKGPVFQIDLEHKSGELAAEILQEEVWELAGACLPIDVEYSVTVVSIQART